MPSELVLLLASLALILGNGFFVAAEYSLVSARRSSIEAQAKKGNSTAKVLLEAMGDIAPYVAGVQIAITMLGIGVGLVAEPFVSGFLERLARQLLGHPLAHPLAQVVSVVSLLLITYVSVVIGELIPKYLSLQRSDEIALLTIRPLKLFITVLKPLVWLVQRSGAAILKPFGIDISAEGDSAIPKEELLMLVRSGGASGTLDKAHADLVSRALRLDVLCARDIMIHRLDIKWIDASLDRLALLKRLKDIPYNRIPLCRGDIDDVAGIVYVHDVVRNLDSPLFNLEKLSRPVVAIPESLSLEKIVETIRREKTQMLIVMDEYGGTSGLVTLEDVVEEVFGELEDRLESDRQAIEAYPGGRYSVRADLRYDELLSRLGLSLDGEDETDTMATIVVNLLGRVPKTGDSVRTALGILRVENMARRRITRVSVVLAPEFSENSED
jgi:CBS domain containing-hemolysin-like protein